MWAEVLGPGVIKFHEAIEVKDGIVDTLEVMADQALLEMYEMDPKGRFGINQSGHVIPIDQISKMPIRINQPLDPDFFGYCDEVIYKNLITYCSHYPDALPSCWWSAGGHVAVYKKGALLGPHSDNDVNYHYGDHPKDQTALFNVVSSTLVLGAGFNGGNLKFEYLDIETRIGPGDHILFPANYMATHSITEIHEGTRYSYISTFGQGTSAPDRGIVIQPKREAGSQGRSWLPRLEKDFIAEVGPDHRFAPRARDHRD